MHLINQFFGKPILEMIVDELQADKGDIFVMTAGYFFVDRELLTQIGSALEIWLKGDANRSASIFVGDWRKAAVSSEDLKEKKMQATKGLAALLAHGNNIRDRLNIYFVPLLHAKLFSLWSLDANKIANLDWLTIGSSNFTPSALNEKNIELDIFIDKTDPQIFQITTQIKGFIAELYDAQTDETELELMLDDELGNIQEKQAIAAALAKKESDAAMAALSRELLAEDA